MYGLSAWKHSLLANCGRCAGLLLGRSLAPALPSCASFSSVMRIKLCLPCNAAILVRIMLCAPAVPFPGLTRLLGNLRNCNGCLKDCLADCALVMLPGIGKALGYLAAMIGMKNPEER